MWKMTEKDALRERIRDLESQRDALQEANNRYRQRAMDAKRERDEALTLQAPYAATCRNLHYALEENESLRASLEEARIGNGRELHADTIHERVANLIRSNSSPMVAYDGFHARNGKQAGYIVYEHEGLPGIIYGILEIIEELKRRPDDATSGRANE